MASMDLDTYKKALEDKSEVPSFAPAVKTQYSRNITVEDWNSIIYSVQGLLSDVSATSEFLMDNSTYQLQYSPTNVRGYSSKSSAESDLENLAVGQLVIINASPLSAKTEIYAVKSESEGKYLQLVSVGAEGNEDAFVYKRSSQPGDTQTIYTGFVSRYTGTDGVRVNYGTNPAEFYVSVTDKSNNYSGAISLGAKTYKFAYDSLVDVFSSDGNTTKIASPMGNASVELGNGEATIKANNTTIEGSTFTLKTHNPVGDEITLMKMSSMYLQFPSGAIFSGGFQSHDFSYFFAPALCYTAPTEDLHLTNKAYVDKTAESKAAEKANAEASRAQEKETSLQEQINAINASQNFVATVSTEADLANIDTSKLEKGVDCVLVLKSTKSGHIDQSVVYQWSTDGAWAFIGELGDYYTKAHVDAEFAKTNGNVAYYRSQTESYAKKVDTYTNSTDDKIADLSKVVDTAKDAYLASTPTFVETSSSTEESDVAPTLVGLFAETGSETSLSE